MHFLRGESEALGHGMGHAGNVAGEHVGLDPAAVLLGHQLAAVRPQCIRCIDDGRHGVVHHQINGCGGFEFRMIEASGRLEVLFRQQLGVAHQNSVTIDCGSDTPTDPVIPFLAFQAGDAEMFAMVNDRFGYGVIQTLFGRGGELHQPLEIAIADHIYVHHGRVALGEGAGLVEDHHIHIHQLLERPAAADQQALAAGAAQGGHDRGGHRHPQTSSQVEHQQGRGLGDVAGAQEQRHTSQHEGGDHEAIRHPARHVADAGIEDRRRLDHRGDLTHPGVLTHGSGFDDQGTLEQDEASQHLIPGGGVARHRFAGEFHHIQRTFTALDHPIHRNLIAGEQGDPIAGIEAGAGNDQLTAIHQQAYVGLQACQQIGIC
jgi:hypothetical protein